VNRRRSPRLKKYGHAKGKSQQEGEQDAEQKRKPDLQKHYAFLHNCVGYSLHTLSLCPAAPAPTPRFLPAKARAPECRTNETINLRSNVVCAAAYLTNCDSGKPAEVDTVYSARTLV
jgi:hypothetical protein